MSASDGVFKNLRQKLDVLGYTQTLPLAGLPLVGALFEDLLKSTESLRDAKKKIVDLLEEKSCWELGVEPYKCNNSRLLAECNQLHQQILRERESYEQRICELNQKIRNLFTDKVHLEQHCDQLQQQLASFLAKQQNANIAPNMKSAKEKAKKPFITTVRSGERIPALMNNENIRCTKCNAQTTPKQTTNGSNCGTNNSLKLELDKFEDKVKDLTEQVEFYKRKIESRDREIRRLNELLSGGRPPAALAKDCCFKDVRGMSEDIEMLQREKSQTLHRLREYQEQMHEAMQRALTLETQNKQLHKELDELKEAALAVETQANTEITQREHELEELQKELKNLRTRQETVDDNRLPYSRKVFGGAAGDEMGNGSDSEAVATLKADKRRLNERINELTQRDAEVRDENDRLQKKIQKLKGKIHSMQKELQDNLQQKEQIMDGEKLRIKAERDFFQKEYLRLISKAGSEKEVEFLQSQIKSKDDELRLLRAELCLRQQERLGTTNVATKTTSIGRCNFAQVPPISERSNPSTNSANSAAASDCVQAVVLRAARERDCVRAELERVRCERDTLREKHVSMLQAQARETEKSQTHVSELNARIRQLERENRELNSARLPSETHIVLLKEEIDELKRRLFALQEENSKLRTTQNQLKILNEQTERTLQEYQSKLTIAEHQLQTADTRLNDLDTNRETTNREATLLRNEVAALKKTYVSLENEKDKLLIQLDAKTERVYQLEFDLKICKEKRFALEKEVRDLEEKLSQLTVKTREHNAELQETSTESKSLRQQITALKISRDEAIAENGRQITELEDEIATLKQEICCRNAVIEQLEDKISALNTQNSKLERQLEEAIDEQRLLKVDLAARKELCEKLDIEKDKLNAELTELNEIKQKLERDNEKLRADMEKTSNGQKVSSETLEELLSKTRRDLEEQIKVDSKLSQELVRLRQHNDGLLSELDAERQRRHQQETLAQEYQIQNQELRHNLTDDRFRQARSREQSPRYPTQTL
ncbi:centrosomal protein of 135 kDa isoform X2 [Eurosta solidaginis]|uniref:centrosomal protein of 135 kDa isoform X2 n=1 Tax=Eurosta solidaginis TaxID=178769 RepID=UPI003530C64F